MEQFGTHLLQANKFFRTADHLAYVSYPLLRDNKLLLIIVQNLYMAGLKAVDAVLQYERMYKRLSISPTDFDTKMIVFEKELAPRISIKPNVCKIIRDLRFIVQQHKNSPIEFSRKEKFIICNDDYSSMKAIDIELLKSYIVTMREFLSTANRLK